MAWNGFFKLGRPAVEGTFEINPSAMTFDERKLVDVGRAIDGSLTAVALSRSRPVFPINGNYITPAMLNQLRSLAMIDDTFLVFEPQADFDLDASAPAVPNNFGTSPFGSPQVFETWQERVVPDSLTQLTLPPDSWTRGDQLRAAFPGLPMIRIVSVADTYRANSGFSFPRVGTTERYDIAGVNSYVQSFDALALGNLNGVVDNAIAWAKIVGGGGDTIFVNAVAPIAGPQDLLITGVPIYRRTFGFNVASFRYTYAFLQGAEASVAFGSGADIAAFTSAPLWVRVFGGFIQIKSNGSPTQTIAYALPGVSHSLTVEFFNGAVVIYLDGVFFARTRCSTYTFDRLFIGAFSGLGGGHLDSFSEQNTNGSFNHATSVITFETALPNLNARFVTFQATGLAAHLKGVPGRTEGGMVDVWRYDLEIEGA